MSNLFSVFDPVTIFSWPLNWSAAVLVSMMFPCKFWLANTQLGASVNKGISSLFMEFKALSKSTSQPGLLLLPVTFFIYILCNNAMGLLPYLFTASSHLTFTVTLALPFWLGHMLMSWAKTTQFNFAHLVPLGTPVALMPFMVLIEIVSSVIRPLTLAVRLAANMVAGHLLLSLLSAQTTQSPFWLLFGLMFALVLLMTLEIAVSIIQAYVFSILSSLYFNEVDSLKISK